MPDTFRFKQFDPNAAQAPASSLKRRRLVPDEERKRAKRACDNCRIKKERCRGGNPCERCTRDNIDCITGGVDSRRGVSDGESNVRLSKGERAQYLESVLKHFLGVSVLPDHELQAMEEVAREAEAAKLRANEKLTFADSGTSNSGVGVKGKAKYAGESSLLTFSRQLEQHLGEANDIETADPGEHHSHLSSFNIPTSSSILASALATLPNPELSDRLVSAFFGYAQCNSFYLPEPWVRDRLSACYRRPLVLTDNDFPGVATLLAVLAIGSQFLGMFPESDSLLVGLEFPLEELGHRLFQCGSQMLPALILRSNFESVHACMLLATYLFPVDLPNQAYTYLGLALHMAMKNGMHKNRHKNSDPTIQEVKNRVWWTLYTFYQRARIHHGHPKTLSHSDVDTPRPRYVQELEPLNGASHFRNQVTLIDVTLVLEDIANEIALLRKDPKAVHIANMLSFRQRLIRIKESMPDIEQSNTETTSLECLRLDIHFYLHYWHARLFLGRPFLLSHATSLAATPTSRDILAKESLDAAVEIIRLCQIIRDRIGLARASYATEFTSCRAAMLVLIASSISDRNSPPDSTLAQGIELVEQMAVGQGQASSDARVIKALQHAITRLHKNPNSIGAAIDAFDPNAPDDFFKEWELLWQRASTTPTDTTGNVFSTNTFDNPASTAVEFDADTTCPDIGTMDFTNMEGESDDVWSHFFRFQLDEFSLIPDINF